MDAKLKVRDMRMKDVHAAHLIGRGARELYASEGGGWYPETALREWLRHRRGDILLVCEADGEVVGFCFTYVLYRKWALMDSMAVRKDRRRSGAATAMMGETARRMERLGVVYAQGYVNVGNRAMLALMGKLGFRRGSRFYSFDRLFPKNFR